jgi:GntR family transcriptional regulator of vanillate catabolism
MQGNRRAVAERLREMVLHGEYPGGTRLREIPLSELLEVSRTPIREALITLAEEGLVEYRQNRGYIVRSFDLPTIMNAYTVREALEGLACRLLAEKGLPHELRAQFEDCLAEGDRILSVNRLSEGARAPWGAVNNRFHKLIAESTGNTPLIEALARVTNTPYTSSRVVHWFEEGDAEGLYELRAVHAQHHSIYESICAGEGYRAETGMRGHIHIAANHIYRKYTMTVDDSPKATKSGAKSLKRRKRASAPRQKTASE